MKKFLALTILVMVLTACGWTSPTVPRSALPTQPAAPAAPTPTPAAPYAPTPMPEQPAAPATTAAGQAAPAQPQFGVVEPQPYVPHPSSYQETGTRGTITWTINVPAGTILVYGGFSVNNETNGVYGAIAGPTTVTLMVTDGFYSVVKAEWARQEYCFRLGEATQYGWAHTHLHPLPGWSCP